MESSSITIYALALVLGMVAGMRAMTAPAAVAWAANLGFLSLTGTWLAFLANRYTAWIATVLAVAELIGDQLPSTPSRKVPVQFGTRILIGGMCGTALGLSGGSWIGGLLAGVAGAVLGTLGGAELRRRLAAAFKKDLPAALIEDALAVGTAACVIVILS